MALSDEDKRRIYEEEKARSEARQRVEVERIIAARAHARAVAEKKEEEAKYQVLGYGVVALVVIIIVACIIGFSLHGSSDDDAATKAVAVKQQAAYSAGMQTLTDNLANSAHVVVTWPYLTNDHVLAATLPPVNGEFTDRDTRALALDIYRSFVNVRQSAGMDDPHDCIVHLFDDTGKEVANANEGGVQN